MIKTLLKITLGLLLALSLSACGVFGGGEPDEDDPMELIEFEQTIDVEEIWSVSAGKGHDRRAPKLHPAYSNGRLWVADTEGRLIAIDAENGDRKADYDLEMDLSAGPAVFGNQIFLGTFEGQLLSVDANTGEIEWRSQLSSEILAHPVMQDGIVVVRCIDGRMFGINADNGQREWVYDRNVPVLTLRGNSAPLVRGGQLFTGKDDGTVIAIRIADGTLLWEARVSVPEGRSQLDRLADIDGSLVIVGSDLYAVTRHGRMASVALDSGRVQWVKEVKSHTGISVSRTQLATTDIDDIIWVVDRQSGDTLWRNDGLLRRGLTQPVAMGDQWVVADSQGYLHWLDGTTGELTARVKASKEPPAEKPMVVGNTLYLFNRDGHLSAWQLRGST